MNARAYNGGMAGKSEAVLDGKKLGARIAEFRAAAGMSLDEVASRAGSTKSHIWELEAGRSRNPTVATLVGLCRAFGCSIDEFLDTTGPVKPTEIAVCMGMDAMRISLGMSPRNATSAEVLAWLRKQVRALP